MTRVPSSLREQVRVRAGKRCEYCHKPEGISAYDHQADHIIALKHGGPTSLDNLAWACFQCNNTKGSDIASYDEVTGNLTPLYNPRTEEWHTHFMMDGPIIIGKTAIGRVTIRLLQLNHPEQVETRRNLIAAGLWEVWA